MLEIAHHKCTVLERNILAIPVEKGGVGVTNSCFDRSAIGIFDSASKKVSAPIMMVEQIHLQAHIGPDDSKIQALKRTARKEKNLNLNDQAKSVNGLA